MPSITIAGYELFPETVAPRRRRIGGPIREALDGTGYRKDVAQKVKLAVDFPYLTSDEFQAVLAVWESCRAGAVTISCSNPLVSGSFLLADDELAFDPLEGSSGLWRGSFNFRQV